MNDRHIEYVFTSIISLPDETRKPILTPINTFQRQEVQVDVQVLVFV